MISDRCLILFVKYPHAGRVKTRLAQTHGRSFAAGLYRAFVFDMLANLAEGDYRLRIFFHPPGKEAQIKKLLGNPYDYRVQQGADLGERMKNAFAGCFSEDFRSAVLIGSDCPDLSLRVIENAFERLEGSCDAVIGPAADGGYYLIGFKSSTFLPDIFCGRSWGQSTVLKETMDIFHAGDLKVKSLQRWRDIDTAEDLADLIEKTRGTPFAGSCTIAFLKAHGMVPVSA